MEKRFTAGCMPTSKAFYLKRIKLVQLRHYFFDVSVYLLILTNPILELIHIRQNFSLKTIVSTVTKKMFITVLPNLSKLRLQICIRMNEQQIPLPQSLHLVL